MRGSGAAGRHEGPGVPAHAADELSAGCVCAEQDVIRTPSPLSDVRTPERRAQRAIRKGLAGAGGLGCPTSMGEGDMGSVEGWRRPALMGPPLARSGQDREWVEKEARATLEEICDDLGREWLLWSVLALVGSRALQGGKR